MKMQSFTVGSSMMLVDFIKSNIFGAGFAFCKTVLGKRDVKVNGKRVGTDIRLEKGDVVQVYYADNAIKDYKPYSVVYEDDNVFIVFKKQGIEVTSPHNKNTLESLVGFSAAHRLDVNTEGLVVFSKKPDITKALREGFEKGYIEKYYLALCFGKLNHSPLTLTGYLKKDAKAGEVEISKEGKGKPVKTVISFVRSVGDFSLVRVRPYTGRTHQIRAHLASIKLYIVGDGKYGNTKLNSIYRYDKQCLCADCLVFKFPSGSGLEYLNKKKLEVTPSFLN